VRNDALKGEDDSDSGDYSEGTLVEESAIREFEKLGYTFLNCFNEKIGLDGKGAWDAQVFCS
jgi:type I restriction enzyme R subunit